MNGLVREKTRDGVAHIDAVHNLTNILGDNEVLSKTVLDFVICLSFRSMC